MDFVSYRETFVCIEFFADKFGFDIFYLRRTIGRSTKYIIKTENKKIVDEDDIIDTIRIINEFCKYTIVDKEAISPVRDIKDLYLLSLADIVQADYILTGDKDLLTLQYHNQTKIVTYNEFVALTENT